MNTAVCTAAGTERFDHTEKVTGVERATSQALLALPGPVLH